MDEEVTQLEGGSQRQGSTEVLQNGKSVAEVIQMEEVSILLGESHEEEVAAQKKKKEEEEAARALIKEADKERELIAEYEEIRRLCGGETDFNKSLVCDAALKKLAGFTQSLCNGMASISTATDKVDSRGGKGSICIEVLKTLIRRLDTEKNPANVISIGDSIGTGKMLCAILDKKTTEEKGFLNYAEYKELISPSQDQTDSANQKCHAQLVKYFHSMANGKKLVMWPPPVFIPLVTFTQLILFSICSQDLELENTLEFHTDCILQRWWGYLTYSLLHVDFGHLFLNLLLQCGVGLGLEMVHGSLSIMILYVLGVLSGSLAFFCFSCGSLHGASGGVYCLIAASFSTCVMNWNEDVAIFMTRFRKGKTPLACGGKMTRILKVVSLICFFGFDFGHAAYRSYYLIDAGSSVIAHLGGTITGVLLGFIVLKDVNVERWEKLLKVVCASSFFFLMGLAFGVNLTGSRRAAGLISSRTCATAVADCFSKNITNIGF